MLLLLAGALYFSARPSEEARIAAVLARADKSAAPPQPIDADDAVDTALVRQLLESTNRTQEQTTELISAAGRRYVRRKQAYTVAKAAADAGRSSVASLDPLEKDLESARKVCDVAESLGFARDLTNYASADAQLERILAGGSGLGFGLADKFIGANTFTEADLAKLETAFEAQYGRRLPISAHGESAAHRALGFDHRGRVDVALSPSQPEGAWLRRYLTGKGITYFAFSGAVRGKATGAHIHIGPPSGRIVPATSAVARP